MSASSPAVISSTSGYNNSFFWERLWRMSGINFVAFAILAFIIYGNQPGVGASADSLITFFGEHRLRILIAAFVSGMAVLNLLWFAAAIRTTLADAGQGGWGAAATAASAATGGAFLLLIAVSAGLAYSIASYENNALTSGLNDLSWAGLVLSSFPRAMLIMAGSFGLWRARLISNSLFAVGVSFVVLVLLGGSTWASEGFWAPDGVYSRFVSPVLGIVWVLGASRILLARAPATRAGW